ncbi:MAG: ABC transporter substrate-binding protein [Acidimicrobiales bacterium]
MGESWGRREFLKAAGLGAAGLWLGGCGDNGTSKVEGPATTLGVTGLEPVVGIERPKLKIGFIPITCATPIIMAGPQGFYTKHGLDVSLMKFAGWAEIRDAFIAGEIDASHLLSPMPLAITNGFGSAAVTTRLSVIGNINGQAITLAKKHQGTVKGPADLKGMVLAVPFPYSMHNFLLRNYLASARLDPDRDADIRVMRPADMVANLISGNIDGYLGPDPFNQRAVFQDAGFIHMLTKDMWDGHPCCGFAVQQSFIDTNPNTYKALLRGITDAAVWAHDPSHRPQIAAAIAPAEYLNQPLAVVEAVLTGNFADGKGGNQSVPNRIDFDPYPWQSFGVWMLAQMVRWGLAPKEKFARPEDFAASARAVFDTDASRAALVALGSAPPKDVFKSERILGMPFDPLNPLPWTQKLLT